jgi:soluble P-type ATPase
MIELVIPNYRSLALRRLVLDVNGTLALDGVLLPGVAERLARLKAEIDLHLLTADTHGRQAEIDRALGTQAILLRRGEPEAERKAAYVRALEPESVVAIGNSESDRLMLGEAALGVAVLGPEGLAMGALREADIAAADIGDALDLLLHPKRLVGTLRR